MRMLKLGFTVRTDYDKCSGKLPQVKNKVLVAFRQTEGLPSQRPDTGPVVQKQI